MAGRIPQSFIDELLARVDIVGVVESRVSLKRAGREYQANCPFHDEKTPSFTVSPAKQFYHCFGCGVHGTAIGFLMEYDHLGFLDAVEELAQSVGLKVPREAARRDDGLDAVFEVLARADRYYQRQLRETPAAVEYLKQRGISGEVAKAFAVGYAPDRWDALLGVLGGDRSGVEALEKAGLVSRRDDGGHYDKFRGRIMFPIHDTRGRPIAFGGRVLADGDGPKYLNSPETPLFHKGRQLYGLFQARQARSRLTRLVVVEGYMDVVSLAQFGLTETVATLGTATTTDQAEILFRSAPEIVFCFDGDRAGRQAALRAMEAVLPRLRDGRQARFLLLAEGEDPDSAVRARGVEEFRAALERATALSDFFFAHYRAQVDMHTLDGRARLVELCRPALNRIPDGVFRDMMFERLAELARTQVPVRPAAAPRVRRGDGAGRPSLVRLAVGILVQQPTVAAGIGDVEDLADLEKPGIPLLLELIAWCRNAPDATTAHVLEHFRGRPEERHLAKLAGSSLLAEGHDLAGEFECVLEQLRRERRRQRLAALQRRVEETGLGALSADEKREMTELQRAGSGPKSARGAAGRQVKK